MSSELINYVMGHTGRGECRCGRCFDRGDSPDPTGHVADLVFFPVSAVNSPAKEDFISLTNGHSGEYLPLDVFDGQEHNYQEIGGWIGDQQAALLYMGLGALLGVFDLMTPKTMVPGIDDRIAMELAAAGFVSVMSKGT